MSDLFEDDPRVQRVRDRRPRILLLTLIVVVAGFLLLTLTSSLWTERLWFGSLGYEQVFSTMLWTRVGLFLVFGAVMALVVGGNMLVAYRVRPLFRPASPDQAGLDRYRDAVLPVRTWLMAGVSLLAGAFAGASASGQWRAFLLWRNSESFGQKDPYFDRDVGFYVFDLPWLHYLLDYTMVVLVLALIASACVHYLFGGIRLQVAHDRLSPAAIAQFSVLLGLFVLVKAGDYWLDRFDLLNESGPLITGMNYADEHAVWPARNILAGIALVCAVLFFLNVWRRTWAMSAMGLAMMIVSSVLVGMIWPAVIQQVSVKPSEADKEAPYLANNMRATRQAYDIEDVVVQPHRSQEATTPEEEPNLDGATSSLPVVDPSLVRRSFEQQQQVRSYYTVPEVLDVDRYSIGGRDRALVVGLRELDQTGLDEGAQNWSNLHTVYTHGNGVIAAYANQRPEDDLEQSTVLEWAEGQDADQRALEGLSPDGYESRIYYGERSPSYSIVGKVEGGKDVEFGLADTATDAEGTTTYDGAGGVSVGGLWHKLLYAVKFGEPNILLSGRVNDNSKILYNRNPGDMVKKVAPWLTVDSDPFPAVVDGRIVWILDGYTTTDEYPQSQRESFETMVDDSLAADTGFQTLPTDEINYVRNAVKATVDAYDGSVTLYAWDDSDPILKAWRSAFPGVVKDKAEIPEALRDHLRYPEDLFKVQRYQYQNYHVDDAKSLYEKDNVWVVPKDPESKAKLQPPYRIFVNPPVPVEEGEAEPAPPDPANEVYALTSVYVPKGKESLASYLWVNSDATSDDYGKLQLLSLPTDDAPDGPSLISNAIQTDQDVRAEVFKFTSSDVEPHYGNMLTLPVADGLMYVQPLYASKDADASSPPNLQFMLVSYGGKVGIGETLDEAIADVLQVDPDDPGTTPPAPGPTTGPTDPATPETPTGRLSPEVRRLLGLADDAYQRADRLQRQGDTAGWADEIERARGFVDDALALLDRSGKKSTGG